MSRSKLARRGTTAFADMLPRSEFSKPPGNKQVASADFLTVVQEMKQHLSGASVVASIVNSARRGVDGKDVCGKGLLVQDLCGYDAAAAIWCHAEGLPCLTVCHTATEETHVQNAIADTAGTSTASSLVVSAFDNFIISRQT